MASLELRQLSLEDQTELKQLETARRVQEILWEDFIRLDDMREDELRGSVDPANEETVRRQREKLLAAAENGVVYGGFYQSDAETSAPDSLHGIVKIGEWRHGDAAPFEWGGGFKVTRLGRKAITNIIRSVRTYPDERGLFAFAMTEQWRDYTQDAFDQVIDLESPVLRPEDTLIAQVDEADGELSLAMRNRGAKLGNQGILAATGHDRLYRLHVIAPRVHE